MGATNGLAIAFTPVRLHSASSARIPHSVHNFRNLIPSVKLQSLYLDSTSSINLHGLTNASIFKQEGHEALNRSPEYTCQTQTFSV